MTVATKQQHRLSASLGKRGENGENRGKLGAFDGIVSTHLPPPRCCLPQIAVINLKVQGATKARTPNETKVLLF